MENPTANMLQLFKPGDTISGYCNGFFGRDDYGVKVCVYVRPQYAVFEYRSGNATVLNIDNRLTLEIVSAWKVFDTNQ